MKGYIEEGAWCSCSFDLAGVPKQLQRRFDKEDNKVQYSEGKRLLTIQDKNTKECFKCKLVAKQWGGLAALVGGIVVGVAMVLSGPVGWIALGALVAVAITTTVAVFSHDCASFQKSGEWTLYHNKVKIKGEKAILYNKSILTCSNMGILIASETKEIAQKVSDDMKWNTRIELGLQILSNAIIGGVTGYGVIDKGGADLDLSTVPLSVASYIHTDFIHPEYTWSESALVGFGYTASNFILGSSYKIPRTPSWIKHLGTEISIEDGLVAGITTVVGAGSDYLEGKLSESADKVVENISKSSNDSSSKSIVSLDY